MFAKLSIYTTALFSVLAVATPLNVARGYEGSSCSTGPVQCCNSVQGADNASSAALLGLLGIVLQDVTAQVGIICSPITVIGVGSSGCSAQAVCCEDNSHGGLVSIGCVPVQL